MREADCYSGAKVGRLTLISRKRVSTKQYGNRWEWLCKCDCGKYRKAYTFRLGEKDITDCGNHTHEKLVEVGKKGRKSSDEISDTNTRSIYRRLYIKWVDMHKRCENPKSSNYTLYGARGIKVCAEWSQYDSFKKWALEQGYNPYNNDRNEQSLDRIDVNGDYEPNNCRFVNSAIQNGNKRNNVVFKYSFDDIADITKLDITYLRNQYYHNDKYKQNNVLFIKDMMKKGVQKI